MKSLSLLLSASVAALTLVSSGASAQDKNLTVAWYGGNWGDAFQACVAEPFTKETGIKVTAEIGTSTTTLAKLQQQASAPTIDVAYMDGGISELAQEAGVLAPIDLSKMPNAANLSEKAAYKAGNDVFAISGGYYSLGLTYNTKEIEEAPTSWEALWDEDYAGAVTIPSPSNSAGIPFIFFLNKMLGGTPADMSATFAKLKELDANMFFDSSGAASNAFQSGEVIIGAHFNVGAWALADAGLPIGFTVPKEGVWATDARLHLVKGSKNSEAAEKFLNTAMSAEAGQCLAAKLYLGPAVKNVELTPEVSRKLPWGEKGSVDDLLLFDWNEVNAKRSELTETWNREVAR
ncbi:polyamine ABC transporter substrate-binding protein [Agaricicola taiwanensis]|uniref:Polyamine ABC transporter substrate-binding protein n=1 Tax=Agaricicola taiwanensis TaxID=591372 RepID=A0A8J3E067_9RHOB|nr:ABC transporter substrate-binding protein [Agaricicola taiwanensis]GGE53037.1 polyamine ABC transporter substrate-binding protein [Agaricicola taiwanensis]